MSNDAQYLNEIIEKSKRRYTMYTVLVFIAFALIAAVLGYIFISRTTPATVVMSDYLAQSERSLFTGYNGAGVININLKGSVFQNQMSVLQFDEESSEPGKIYLDSHSNLNSPGQIFRQFILADDSFDVYPTTGLSNGDVVTVHWTFGGFTDSVNELFSHLNFNIEYPDIEIVVSGLRDAPVLTSYNQVPDTLKEELQQKANEILYSEEVSTWDSSVQNIESVQFLESRFQCNSNLSKNVIDELFYVTESIQTYENEEPVVGNVSFYWYVRFFNATRLSDNSVYIDTSSYETPETAKKGFRWNYGFGSENFIINGFESYEEMIESLALE